MAVLMWVGIYALLIVINGALSSILDNEHEAINLENVSPAEKTAEDYQVLRGE